MGGWINWFTDQDRNPAFDLPDVTKDIPYIGATGGAPVQWRWYQNGYDHEPTDPGSEASHQNYVSHHNGAQYFGYIANNPAEQTNLRGEGDFFSDMTKNVLPRTGGVFYIRGGYYNLKYPNNSRSSRIRTTPIKTASRLTSSRRSRQRNPATTIIRAIPTASSRKPWPRASSTRSPPATMCGSTAPSSSPMTNPTAVTIYVPPRILSYGPDGLPIARGIRIPLLLISPYARVHAVSHAEGDHNAIIETINALFGLPALSSLPDEKDALAAGDSPKFNAFGPPGFEQNIWGRATRTRP
jgi:phospholipase C